MDDLCLILLIYLLNLLTSPIIHPFLGYQYRSSYVRLSILEIKQ